MDRELLIEIGVEEVPASWLPGLTRQLADVTAAQLRAARLDVDGPVESWTTPRRLTVRVARVAERQTDKEEVVNGPPVSAARDASGELTPAAIGFAKKNGVEPSELEEIDTPKGRYLAVRKRQRGRASVDALPDVMSGLLRGLAFPKTMRWDAGARRRQGRAAVRPADSLAAVPLRRPRRPVRHPSHRDRAGAAGAGSAIGRDDLRAPVPHHQRSRRPRREGEDVRRLQGPPARALRRPGSRGAARADRAASSTSTPADWAGASIARRPGRAAC